MFIFNEFTKEKVILSKSSSISGSEKLYTVKEFKYSYGLFFIPIPPFRKLYFFYFEGKPFGIQIPDEILKKIQDTNEIDTLILQIYLYSKRGIFRKSLLIIKSFFYFLIWLNIVFFILLLFMSSDLTILILLFPTLIFYLMIKFINKIDKNFWKKLEEKVLNNKEIIRERFIDEISN